MPDSHVGDTMQFPVARPVARWFDETADVTSAVDYQIYTAQIQTAATGVRYCTVPDFNQTTATASWTWTTDTTASSNYANIFWQGTATAGQWTDIQFGPIGVAANDPEEVRRQALLQAIRQNLAPAVRRRTVLRNPYDAREAVARASLRDMLSEADWRRYVTNGFIMVKGASGYWYQLFASGERVQVYNKGAKIAAICIHSTNVPPTDHVINMKLLIELDEHQVWHGGNVSMVWNGAPPSSHRPRPLIEVAQQYRRAA